MLEVTRAFTSTTPHNATGGPKTPFIIKDQSQGQIEKAQTAAKQWLTQWAEVQALSHDEMIPNPALWLATDFKTAGPGTVLAVQ